jgi:hypothetical protein
MKPAHFAARNTSPSSEEFDHGTCLPLVLATTSARTRVSICCTSIPGVPRWRESAAENGLLAPSPSSATCPGAVANAIRVPAARVAPAPSADGAASRDPALMARSARRRPPAAQADCCDRRRRSGCWCAPGRRARPGWNATRNTHGHGRARALFLRPDHVRRPGSCARSASKRGGLRTARSSMPRQARHAPAHRCPDRGSCAPGNLRKRSASGHAAANARRMRLVVEHATAEHSINQ